MKKTLHLLAITLLGSLLFLTSCEKDRVRGGGNGGGQNFSGGKELTGVTVYNQSNGMMAYEATLQWQNGHPTSFSLFDYVDNNGNETVRADMQWNGNMLQGIVAYSRNSNTGQLVLEGTVGLSYNGATVSEITYNDMSEVQELQTEYHNGRLSRLLSDIHPDDYIEFRYDQQGNPTGIAMFYTENGMPQVDEPFSLSWTGINIVSGESYGDRVSLQYNSNLLFPLNGLLNQIFSLFGLNPVQLNCPTSIVTPEGQTVTISYQSSDGVYPSSATATTDNETMILHFTYSDGTGSNGVGDNGGGNSGNGTMTINYNGSSWQPYLVKFYDLTDENYIAIDAYKTNNLRADIYITFYLESFTGNYSYDDYGSWAEYIDNNYTFTPTETRIINVDSYCDTIKAGVTYQKYVADIHTYQESITAINLTNRTISATWREEIIDWEEYYNSYGMDYHTYLLSGILNNYHWDWTTSSSTAPSSTFNTRPVIQTLPESTMKRNNMPVLKAQ